MTAEVAHLRWDVRRVAVTGGVDGFGRAFGGVARPPDVAHFSQGVRAVFGRFRPAAVDGHGGQVV